MRAVAAGSARNHTPDSTLKYILNRLQRICRSERTKVEKIADLEYLLSTVYFAQRANYLLPVVK